jgi:TolB-like protein
MEFGQAPRMIRFGHCTLDEGRGVLIAPDGSETPLRPKTHELLRLLLKHPGRVVPRAEILDSVWPGIFVTDDSITQCVVELRKAMGPGGSALLRTLPRRGYLLQADVIAEALPEPAPAGRSDDRPSIAVLPFRKEKGDGQEAYFEDGIIEGIVHVLSGLERILVISRGSALAVAEQTTDPREVGKRLGVRYVLHGGVRRAGERLRITTELSEAETGASCGPTSMTAMRAISSPMQDRIAEAVSR